MSATYLLSYDIKQRLRLQRLQRFLKSQCHMVLESQYLFSGDWQAYLALQTHLPTLLRADDSVWIYRLDHEQPLWRYGTACARTGILDFTLPQTACRCQPPWQP